MKPPLMEQMRESPWNRFAWSGDLESVDGCDASDFVERDVAVVVAWDDDCAGIVLLKDGRFVGWESWTDVTGSGFCADAYGGNIPIWFAKTLRPLVLRIAENVRECLRWMKPVDVDGTRLNVHEAYEAAERLSTALDALGGDPKLVDDWARYAQDCLVRCV